METNSLPIQQIVKDNYRRVCERVENAALRAGRDPQSIRVVGVTKYVDAIAARALYDAGCHDLAESRPQELWSKNEALSDLEIRWHFIGHMQRNKLKKSLPLLHCFHSLDSQRLLDSMIDETKSQVETTEILLEVNISGDATKTGLPVEDAHQLLLNFPTTGPLRVVGLMGMSALASTPQEAQTDFAKLRKLMEHWQAEMPQLQLKQLSMGMSGDFEEAIIEGATMVRIGSTLFDGVPFTKG